MTENYEVFLSDFNPETQKKILKFLGIKDEKEGNLDVFPLTLIPKPEPLPEDEEVEK